MASRHILSESHNVRFEIINDPISYINDYINNQNILDISDLSNLNKTLDEIIEDINDIKEILSLKGKI